jgi:hypothetical protein
MQVPVFSLSFYHTALPILPRRVLFNGNPEWYEVEPEDTVRSLLLQVEVREGIRAFEVTRIVIETEEAYTSMSERIPLWQYFLDAGEHDLFWIYIGCSRGQISRPISNKHAAAA